MWRCPHLYSDTLFLAILENTFWFFALFKKTVVAIVMTNEHHISSKLELAHFENIQFVYKIIEHKLLASSCELFTISFFWVFLHHVLCESYFLYLWKTLNGILSFILMKLVLSMFIFKSQEAHFYIFCIFHISQKACLLFASCSRALQIEHEQNEQSSFEQKSRNEHP